MWLQCRIRQIKVVMFPLPPTTRQGLNMCSPRLSGIFLSLGFSSIMMNRPQFLSQGASPDSTSSCSLRANHPVIHTPFSIEFINNYTPRVPRIPSLRWCHQSSHPHVSVTDPTIMSQTPQSTSRAVCGDPNGGSSTRVCRSRRNGVFYERTIGSRTCGVDSRLHNVTPRLLRG